MSVNDLLYDIQDQPNNSINNTSTDTPEDTHEANNDSSSDPKSKPKNKSEGNLYVRFAVITLVCVGVVCIVSYFLLRNKQNEINNKDIEISTLRMSRDKFKETVDTQQGALKEYIALTESLQQKLNKQEEEDNYGNGIKGFEEGGKKNLRNNKGKRNEEIQRRVNAKRVTNEDLMKHESDNEYDAFELNEESSEEMSKESNKKHLKVGSKSKQKSNQKNVPKVVVEYEYEYSDTLTETNEELPIALTDDIVASK